MIRKFRNICKILLKLLHKGKRQNDLPNSKPSPELPLASQPTDRPPPPPYTAPEQALNCCPDPDAPVRDWLAHSQCGCCVKRHDIHVRQPPRSGLGFDKRDYWGLVKDDEGLAGVLCSLGSLYKVFSQHSDLLSLIHEADERPASVLCQHLCSQILAELRCPPSLRSSSVEALQTYTTRIIDSTRTRTGPSAISIEGPPFCGKATDILQFLQDTGIYLEWLNWHHVTTTQFALIVGFHLGQSNRYVPPDISMANMVELAMFVGRERQRERTFKPAGECALKIATQK